MKSQILGYTPIRVKLFFSFLLSLICLNTCIARHIIGSDFYYNCLGSGRAANTKAYGLSLTIYRDCYNPQGSPYDPDAIFGIYRFDGNRYTYVTQFTVNHGTISRVKADNNPCLIIPPNVCVEESTYSFEVDLPIINETYIIYYQRCCRNNTIINLVDPNNTGATFFIEISPEAQRTCNNSPRFNSFPPILICTNFPFDIDQSAIDIERDSLVYEFCSPLAGGGSGASDPNGGSGCAAVRPDPRQCAPPFQFVNFINTFNTDNPMGSGVLKLNRYTGKLSGSTFALGQYVVGICVKEYRAGVLIGAIHRDFQFNVLQCSSFQEKFIPNADKYTIQKNKSINFDVLLNDSINGSFDLNIKIDQPKFGNIIFSNKTGKGSYTPNYQFIGKEEVKYTVCPLNCNNTCSSSSITFTVEPPCADKTNLVLPNIIFPEGSSGQNKYFIVEALNKCPDDFGTKPTKFSVYSRWGDLVYRDDDYRNDWAGTNNHGQPLPGGTYYYLLDLGSVNAPVKGYVVIMR